MCWQQSGKEPPSKRKGTTVKAAGLSVGGRRSADTLPTASREADSDHPRAWRGGNVARTPAPMICGCSGLCCCSRLGNCVHLGGLAPAGGAGREKSRTDVQRRGRELRVWNRNVRRRQGLNNSHTAARPPHSCGATSGTGKSFSRSASTRLPTIPSPPVERARHLPVERGGKGADSEGHGYSETTLQENRKPVQTEPSGQR